MKTDGRSGAHRGRPTSGQRASRRRSTPLGHQEVRTTATRGPTSRPPDGGDRMLPAWGRGQGGGSPGGHRRERASARTVCRDRRARFSNRGGNATRPRGAAERAAPRSRPQTGGAARRGTAGLPAARVGAGLTPDCATALNSARSLKPSPCALNQEACGAYEISVKLGDTVLGAGGGGRAPQAFWASAAASWTKRSHSVCRVPLDACVEHPRSPG